jgi:mono/diheme cytochrome c family protein
VIDSFYAMLARIGFTDPPHALLTHMPIGLITGALLFLLVAVIFRRRVLEPTARHVFVLGFIFLFPTILFGVLDWLHYFRGAMILPIKFKIGLAAAVLVVTAAGVAVGNRAKLRTIPQVLLYALAFVCVVGLGYFGAKMVYAGWAPEGSEGVSGAGSELFTVNCQACHPGGGNIVDPSYPVKGSPKLASVETFTAFLRSPGGMMPSFDEQALSAAQARDLHQYLSRKDW